MSDKPINMAYGTGNDARRIAELEAENRALREVLERTRGQWIHSVHAKDCLAVLEGKT